MGVLKIILLHFTLVSLKIRPSFNEPCILYYFCNYCLFLDIRLNHVSLSKLG